MFKYIMYVIDIIQLTMDNFQASHTKFTPYLPKIFRCHVQIWGLPKSKFRQAGNASRWVPN